VLTFGPGTTAAAASSILLRSWEAFENYTSPLGLGYIVDATAHYWMDPAGWCGLTKPPNNGFGGGFNATPSSFGFDRALTYGATYADRVYSSRLLRPETTPPRLLLTFHHLPYDHKMPNGRPLIQEFYRAYTAGVETACGFVAEWEAISSHMDPARHELTARQLGMAVADATNFSHTMTEWFAALSGIQPEFIIQGGGLNYKSDDISVIYRASDQILDPWRHAVAATPGSGCWGALQGACPFDGGVACDRLG
jgi:alpha-glucuronidase